MGNQVLKTTEFQSRMYRDRQLRKTAHFRYRPVGVFGAGAIGAGAIVRLVSQGYGNLIIVDFDRLEVSNLSRGEFLYNARTDIGRPKAERAARRAQAGMVDGGRAIGLDMDVLDIGARIIAKLFFVICCLDSVAARIHLNNQCRLAGVPFIETGTNGLFAHAQLFNHKGACYSCHANGGDELAHHSCSVEFRRAVEQGQTPATPIASTMSSTLAANLMTNYLCGITESANIKLFYDGRNFEFFRLKLRPSPGCPGCTYTPSEEMVLLEQTTDLTLGEALAVLEKECGQPVTLVAQNDLVVSAECPICGCWYQVGKPIHRLYENERRCPDCEAKGQTSWSVANPTARFVSTFNNDSAPRLLEMTLFDLGFPRGAVITALKEDGNMVEFGFEGDSESLLGVGALYGSIPVQGDYFEKGGDCQ